MLEVSLFLDNVSKFYNRKINSYDEFLKIMDVKENISWNNVISNIVYDYRIGNGIDPMEIMNGWFIEDSLFSFVIIDNKCPIIMDMSYRKITMPHSELRSSGVFMHIKEFNVLGILTQIDNYIFLKPLALWNIIDVETAQSYNGRKL